MNVIFKRLSTNEIEKGSFSPDEELPSIVIDYLNNLFIVKETQIGRDKLFKSFGFGRYTGNYLILSPYEVFFLSLCGANLQFPCSQQDLWNICCNLCGKSIFPTHFAVYQYFRCRFFVVRDGCTFGCDFVLYEDHPDVVHSTFTVSILDNWDEMNRQIVLSTRVGWSVKKSSILVHVSIPDDVDLSDSKCISLLKIEALQVKRVNFR